MDSDWVWNKLDTSVSGSSNGINSQGKVMKLFMTQKESGQRMTLQQSQMTIFDNLGIEDESMLSVEDFHAKLFQLLEREKDLTTLEGLYSLKLHVSPISSDHAIYSLKTSRDSSTMRGGYLRDDHQNVG